MAGVVCPLIYLHIELHVAEVTDFRYMLHNCIFLFWSDHISSNSKPLWWTVHILSVSAEGNNHLLYLSALIYWPNFLIGPITTT